MTHTFTPPETFPHECLYEDEKCILFSVDTWGEYSAIVHHNNGNTEAVVIYAECLRDLPKVTSTWQNQQPHNSGALHSSRAIADQYASPKRIAVLRRDTIEGVTTCELEAV